MLFLTVSETVTNAQVRSSAQQRARPAQPIETGKFRIYETKEVQGEESYEIRRAEDGKLIVQAKIDLPFIGEEKKPSLTATLRTKDDLTAELFEIKGIRPLEVEIDTSITVQGKTATVRESGSTARELSTTENLKTGTASGEVRVRQLSVPENFFMLGSYVPVTIEMMLVRYWQLHGRKTSLALLPGGEKLLMGARDAFLEIPLVAVQSSR